MVLYTCPRCHYDTKLKGDIKRHYSRKRVCDTIYSRLSIKDCLNQLKIKKKRKSYEELERENQALKECKTVIINNNTINIDNSKNININSYKDTDYSLVGNDMKHCLVQDINGKDVLDMGKLINTLFYDNDENHNIFMSNTNNRRIMEYDGDNFVEKGKNEDGLKRMIMEDLKVVIDKYFDASDISDEFEEIYQKCLDSCNSDFKAQDKEDLRNIFNKMASALVNGKIKVKETFKNNGVKIKRDGVCEELF